MLTVISMLVTMLSIRTAPLRARLRSDRGIEAVEYALVAALLGAVIVGAVALLGPDLNGFFGDIATRLNAEGATISGSNTTGNTTSP